jgi:hypothetical protein
MMKIHMNRRIVKNNNLLFKKKAGCIFAKTALVSEYVCIIFVSYVINSADDSKRVLQASVIILHLHYLFLNMANMIQW